MKRAAILLALIIGLVIGCGGPSQEVETSSSESLLCSERPKVVDGIAMSVGCAFIQQDHNIRTNGLVIGESVPLSDADGRMLARVTHQCGEWLLGQDLADQQVIISRESGEVRSHGTLHAGQTSSALPARLALPLTY